MSEFFFVIKSLVITAIIIVLMQVKISGSTIEDRAENLIEKSHVGMWIQSAASGGALFITHTARAAKNAVTQTAESIDEKTAHAERASR